MAITNRGEGVAVRLALVIALLFIQLLTAPPARAASLEASPSSGAPGASVGITGAGFVPLNPVRLCWDSERCTNLGQAQPTLTGGISTSIRIPGDADGGSHSIHACQQVLLVWSCDSTGFAVSVPPTTTTTAPTTTTTAPTTTTTAAAATTTSSSAPVTTSPPPPPPGANPAPPPPGANPGPPPPGGNPAPPSDPVGPRTGPPAISVGPGPDLPGGGAVEAGPLTNGTSLEGASGTSLEGAASDKTMSADGTTTTSITDDRVLAAAPSYQPPSDGPRLPGASDNGGGEASSPIGEEGRVDEASSEWVIPLLVLVIVGVAAWVADRLIRSDRRSHMMALSRHR